jgi:hypothetical protein
MQCPVIYVGRDSLDSEVRPPVSFLFIGDEMLIEVSNKTVLFCG